MNSFSHALQLIRENAILILGIGVAFLLCLIVAWLMFTYVTMD